MSCSNVVVVALQVAIQVQEFYGACLGYVTAGLHTIIQYNRVWGSLPINTSLYYNLAVLVRHSQAQKVFQINPNNAL